MLLHRNIEKLLQEWKKNKERKPLIIRGARQVGKTTLINELSKNYKCRILLNLEKDSDVEVFNNFTDVKRIVESLFLIRNIPISSLSDTLLFIDEIQESTKAIEMLRFFYEDYPELHVIAAGSLLEFSMKKVKSFPVGRVEFLYLHPLNFIEFLKAINHVSAISYFEQVPINSLAHKTMVELFNQYAIIGGMPEVVSKYVESKSITELPKIYNSIWETYKGDVEKYAANETERKVIKHIMATAHLYIDQRIKLQNFGKSNYRSREVGEAFRNLDDAKVIQLIYPTTDIEVPLKPDLRKSPRLQFLDTGLINHELEIQAGMLALSDLSMAYKGAVIPHLIIQELISLMQQRYQKPSFWVSEKKQASAEVDIVLTYKNMIIPIEIKSGKEGTLRSLHQFVERCNHPYAVRIYGGEFNIIKTKTPGGKPYWLMNMPYYLGTKLYEYLEYFIGSTN